MVRDSQCTSSRVVFCVVALKKVVQSLACNNNSNKIHAFMVHNAIVINVTTTHLQTAPGYSQNTNQICIQRRQEGTYMWAHFPTVPKISLSVAQGTKATTHENFLEHHKSTSLETNWHGSQWVRGTSSHTHCRSVRSARKRSVRLAEFVAASRLGHTPITQVRDTVQ